MKKTRLFWLFTCLMLVLTLASCGQPSFEIEIIGEEIKRFDFIEIFEQMTDNQEELTLETLDCDLVVKTKSSYLLKENGEIKTYKTQAATKKYDNDNKTARITTQTNTETILGTKKEKTDYFYQVAPKGEVSGNSTYAVIDFEKDTYGYETEPKLSWFIGNTSTATNPEFPYDAKYYVKDSPFKKVYTIIQEYKYNVSATIKIQVEATANKVILRTYSRISTSGKFQEQQEVMEIRLKNVILREKDITKYDKEI